MDRDGIGLFLLDANSPGLSRRGYPTPGRSARGGTHHRTGLRAAPLSDNALPLIEHQRSMRRSAALCSEAVGARCRRCNELTLGVSQDPQTVWPARSDHSRCCTASLGRHAGRRWSQARSMGDVPPPSWQEEENPVERRRAISAAQGADRPFPDGISGKRRSSCMVGSV